MTREQLAQKARAAIPDFLRRQKPSPPYVPPANGEVTKPGKIDWEYLFRLAESAASPAEGD